MPKGQGQDYIFFHFINPKLSNGRISNKVRFEILLSGKKTFKIFNNSWIQENVILRNAFIINWIIEDSRLRKTFYCLI